MTVLGLHLSDPDLVAMAPVSAIGFVLLLTAIARWAFAPHRHEERDYGLLVVAVELPSRDAAEQAQDVLRRSRIRATVGHTPGFVRVSAEGRATREPDLHPVLVFPADLDRARSLLRSESGPRDVGPERT